VRAQASAGREWWRQDAAPAARPEVAAPPPAAESQSSRWAFRGLLALTFVMVLAPQSFIPALKPFRIALLSAIAAVATHLVDRWRRAAKDGRRPSREAVLTWCLVGWSAITIPLSYWPSGSLAVLNEYIKSVVVFWLLANIATTLVRLRTLFWALSLMSVPLALTGIKNFASGVTYREMGERIQGYSNALSSNPNDLALTLNILLPLAAALALTARTWKGRLVALVVIGIGVPAVIVTFSRGGFVTLALTLALSVFALMRRGNWAVLGALVVGGLLMLPMVPAGYADRLSTITNVSADSTGSAQERLRDSQTAIALIQAHPITGSGLGMDTLAMNEARGAHWLKVHNAYLDYGIDLGLPGLTLFVALLVCTIRKASRVEHDPGAQTADERELALFAGGLRIGLMGFAVAAFFHPVAYHPYFYILAGLTVGVAECQAGLAARRLAAPLGEPARAV
jgi:O-antigen ligase